MYCINIIFYIIISLINLVHRVENHNYYKYTKKLSGKKLIEGIGVEPFLHNSKQGKYCYKGLNALSSASLVWYSIKTLTIP